MSAPPRRLRLTRAMRLRRGCEFARLRETGRRSAAGCVVVNWMASPPGGVSRLGVITSRRVGSAVIRSRARRLLREAFRLQQAALTAPLLMVLVARPSIVNRSLQEVQHDLNGILRRAGLLREIRPLTGVATTESTDPQ